MHWEIIVKQEDIAQEKINYSFVLEMNSVYETRGFRGKGVTTSLETVGMEYV